MSQTEAASEFHRRKGNLPFSKLPFRSDRLGGDSPTPECRIHGAGTSAQCNILKGKLPTKQHTCNVTTKTSPEAFKLVRQYLIIQS